MVFSLRLWVALFAILNRIGCASRDGRKRFALVAALNGFGCFMVALFDGLIKSTVIRFEAISAMGEANYVHPRSSSQLLD
jgi:hypothetical protein